MGSLPAGWYVDVKDPETEHWWDGSSWSGLSRYVSPADISESDDSAGFFQEADLPVDVGLEGILTGKAFGEDGNSAETAEGDSPRSEPPARPKPIRMLTNVAAMVVLLAVAATGTFLFLTRTPTASAAVTLALASTLNNRTAELNVSGSVGLGASQVTISGTGTVDFSQNTSQLKLETSVHGNQVSEEEVAIGNTLYLQFGPLVNQIVPGKSWISLNLAQLNQGGSASPLGIGGGLSSNSPSAILNVLAQNGNTVTALGQSTINGIAVQGYSVQVNQAAIKRELAQAHLPSWMQQSVAVSGNLNIAYKVFIAGNGTLYRMTIQLGVPVDGQSLNGVLNLDFSDFGAATIVTTPPASQVTSYQNFIQNY
jgi:hypothetical protein